MITLERLRGAWRLERGIEDFRAGLTGRLEGTCSWTPDAAGLVQEETGRLTYGGGPPMMAQRRYLWRADGAAIDVLFEDGRPFHRIEPGRSSDTHHCDPDTYTVTYLFDGPAFSTLWRVTGPRKDLLIRSRYSPL
ncbi:DUF6314 family protein [Roseibacterium sp. SDUM158017]|uniref:DUF6314 family protein n=1 Tax=Roseicyclus salinarum TaxID=3036773 RepID=UPI0024154C03|nr:DUF6314 family protein [Roseibacterium sp. SDUM158017]MDG4648494.1 DUF6314 family protein [Roseibacterium sp. SDUM158017]